jgi:hypothetical protein
VESCAVALILIAAALGVAVGIAGAVLGAVDLILLAGPVLVLVIAGAAHLSIAAIARLSSRERP